MKRMAYYEDGGGRRYELVKSALQGGCPENLKQLENIIKYIDTGDSKYLMSSEELQFKHNEDLQKSLADVKANNERLEAELEQAKALQEQICGQIREIKNAVRVELTNSQADFKEYFGEYHDSNNKYNEITAKALSAKLEDCASAYVMIEGHIHRVIGLYTLKRKAILEVAENGYLIDEEVKNGINQKEAAKRVLKQNRVLTNLGYKTADLF